MHKIHQHPALARLENDVFSIKTSHLEEAILASLRTTTVTFKYVI